MKKVLQAPRNIVLILSVTILLLPIGVSIINSLFKFSISTEEGLSSLLVTLMSTVCYIVTIYMIYACFHAIGLHIIYSEYYRSAYLSIDPIDRQYKALIKIFGSIDNFNRLYSPKITYEVSEGIMLPLLVLAILSFIVNVNTGFVVTSLVTTFALYITTVIFSFVMLTVRYLVYLGINEIQEKLANNSGDIVKEDIVKGDIIKGDIIKEVIVERKDIIKNEY